MHCTGESKSLGDALFFVFSLFRFCFVCLHPASSNDCHTICLQCYRRRRRQRRRRRPTKRKRCIFPHYVMPNDEMMIAFLGTYLNEHKCQIAFKCVVTKETSGDDDDDDIDGDGDDGVNSSGYCYHCHCCCCCNNKPNILICRDSPLVNVCLHLHSHTQKRRLSLSIVSLLDTFLQSHFLAWVCKRIANIFFFIFFSRVVDARSSNSWYWKFKTEKSHYSLCEFFSSFLLSNEWLKKAKKTSLNAIRNHFECTNTVNKNKK